MGRVEQMMQRRGLNVSGDLSAPANAASKAKVLAFREEQAQSKELAALERQRQQAQVDLDTDALNRIDRTMKGIRAAQGKQTVGDRVDDTLSATVQGYAGSLVNAVGTVSNTVKDPAYYRRQIASAQKSLDTGRTSDGRLLTDTQRKTIQENMRRMADEAWKLEQADSFTNRTYRLADRMQDDSAASVSRAKEGLGTAGQLAVDVGVAGGQMGLDALTAALLAPVTGGSALVPMAARSFGGGAQEARRSGASLDQQLLYGVGSAAVSVGTEKISNIAKPFQKMFGRGAAETIAGSLVKRFGENEAVQLMSRLSRTAAGRIALSAIGEGGEEVVEDILQPFLKRATFDKDAGFDAGEAGHDFLVGAILGLLGGGVEQIGSIGSKPGRNRAESGIETARPAPAGVETTGAAEGVRSVQSGAVEPLQVGRVTTIKRPYQGKTPVQAQKSAVTVQVDSGSVRTAQNRIDGARGLEGTPLGEAGGFKATLKKKLQESFRPTKGVEVEGVSFDGKPYLVDINKNVVGKVISDKNLSAEKIALLDVLQEVVKQGEYVGSGEYVQHGSRQKQTVRYDYFESPVEISGKPYIVSFDAEVEPNVNNYRTHKLIKMDLKEVPSLDTGPAPAAAEVAPSGPFEGTRPLNSNPTIAQRADSVKSPADVMTQEARRLHGDGKAAPETGAAAINENGLTALTALERENLSGGKKNKIISTFSEAVRFIQNALTNKQSVDRAYLGKVPDKVAQMVFQQTGVDISGYQALIFSDSVRHMFKDHGDPIVEQARGQIALSPETAAKIPEVLSNPDRVSLSPHADVRGLPVLLFEKAIDGYYITAQAISNGTHSIQADTLYIRKKAPQDTVFNADTTVDPEHNARNVLPQEPFDDSISQTVPEVKADPLLQAILGEGKRVDQSTLSAEQFDRLAELNAQGTVGMDAAGKVYQVDPGEHIDRRSMDTAGSKDLNAFQFDHPELHSYFKRAAEALIADADLSLQFPTVRRYERGAQGRQANRSAEVSAHLRRAMDETGLTRAQLIDAAQRIIDDHGQENVAAAKRVEIILDSMLENGWTAMTGKSVQPNQAYIDAKSRIDGSAPQAETGGYLDGVDDNGAPAGAQRQRVRWGEEEGTQQSGTFGEAGSGAGGVSSDDGLGAADAGGVNTEFDRLRARSDAFHPINQDSARRITEDQGRAPSEVPVTNPDTGANIQKTVSTILNSSLTSPEMAVEIERAVAEGRFDYLPVTDRDAVRRAQADLSSRGLQRVAGEFLTKADLGQRLTKRDMASAIAAYNQAVADGDHATAFDLMAALSDTAHDSAQVVQAMNLMNRLTPEGRLLTLRRFVDRMNRKQGSQTAAGTRTSAARNDIDAARSDFVEQATGFRISDELATNYLLAETEAERAAAWDAITTDIAGQMPSTFMDKANFWRYTSMLLNPTTHIRNLLGNAIQGGARTIKNVVGAAIERAVVRDQTQRTKSIALGKEGKALRKFARAQYEADQKAAMGAGKYSDASSAGIESEIRKKWKAFQGADPISKGIQAVGDFNSRLLDTEDVVFNRSAYVSSFAQALKAKGVTAAEAASGVKADLVESARAYAVEEAQRATYRNATALSEALSKMGSYRGSNRALRIMSFAADAFMPFRRTPANILTTGLDYSPIGILKAIKEGAKDLRRGDCTAADVVDSLSAGLTGSGILALGAYLAAEGLLRVRAGDDDREEAYNKDRGMQDYALQIGDKSYTLDWAVPAAMPLFAGAAIMESIQEGGNGFEAVADAMTGISDVVMETSMLSSLNDFSSNLSYADNKATYLIDRTLTSYAGQYVPTIGSKIASAADDTVRKSYVEKGTGQVASDIDYFRQGVFKKLPGARNTLQPKIDLWGEEVSNGDVGSRLLQNFLSPGYGKTVDTGALDQELRRLAEAVGSSAVYPAAAEKSFKVGEDTKVLTAEEYTRYAKVLGQSRYELIQEAVSSDSYQSMDDRERAGYIGKLYQYANQVAKSAVSGYEPEAWVVNAQNAGRDLGVSPAEYIALYRRYGSDLLSGAGYEQTKAAVFAGLTVEQYAKLREGLDADGNGSVSQAEAREQLDRMQFGREQKADLWTIINQSWKKNPYTP